MRILVAHQYLTSGKERGQFEALIRSVESVLKKLLANSFEIVIRDDKTMGDHLYDQHSPLYNNPENRKVSLLWCSHFVKAI